MSTLKFGKFNNFLSTIPFLFFLKNLKKNLAVKKKQLPLHPQKNQKGA